MAGGISGFQALGNTLAGGNALPAALAEAQGESLGANTQGAIANAQARLAKSAALAKIGEATKVLANPQNTPEDLGGALALFAQSGEDPTKFTGAVHGNQENNSYDTIINPATSDEIVARHLVAQGKPGLITPTAQGEAVTNRLHPDQGETLTDLGKALVPAKVAATNAAANASNANANLHNKQADTGGIKPPTGYQWAVDADGNPAVDENGQRTVVPLGGGPKDPDAPHAMGANQTSQFLRTINSARQAVADLGNVNTLPIGSSTGYFGTQIGASQGHTIGGTLVSNLQNKLNGEDVGRYNTIISGLNQNLSTLETFGLAPRGSLVNSFDRLGILPTDTEEQALTKLAQSRQVVEQALNTHVLDNPNLSDKQKAPLRDLITQIQQAIPFTVQDINALHNSKNGNSTLADMSARHFGGQYPSPAAAPAPKAPAAASPTPTGYPGNAIPTFDTEAQAEAAGLKDGTPVIIGGRQGKWVNQ